MTYRRRYILRRMTAIAQANAVRRQWLNFSRSLDIALGRDIREQS